MVDIRRYKDGDEKGILTLFKSVFKIDRSPDYWKWLYLKNPASPPIIALAEDDSNIVGQCTLLPTKISIKGETILAGQSIDTMVDKDFRGQGLHKTLAEMTYDIGRDNGVKIRIGFPSEDAIRGLLGGIDATLVTEIPLYMNIYKLENFLTAMVKVKMLGKLLSFPSILIIRIIHREKRIKPEKNYNIREILDFNRDFDDLWEKVEDGKQIMSIRNSEFLNWRIKNHPQIKYNTFGAYIDTILVGYIVLKVEDRKIKGKINTKLGSIVDILAVDDDVVLALCNDAKKYFKRKDVDFVATWITDTFTHKDIFASLGFHKSRSKIPFIVKDLDENESYKEIITKEDNWYLMPIESDFY